MWCGVVWMGGRGGRVRGLVLFGHVCCRAGLEDLAVLCLLLSEAFWREDGMEYTRAGRGGKSGRGSFSATFDDC